MKNIFTKTLLSLLCLIGMSLVGYSQEWTAYDGSVYPTEATPALDTADFTPDVNYTMQVVAEAGTVNGNALKFESIESGKFTWRTGDFDPAPTAVTSVMRVKFVSGTVADRVTEIELRSNGLREKLVIYESGRLKLEKAGVDITPETLDVEAWNTYRLTMDAAGVANLYLNEEETPILTGTTTSTTTDNYIKFGDGGGSAYSCLIDYFLHDATGAYTPTESPIPSTLEAPEWVVYDAGVFPTEATPPLDTADFTPDVAYTMEVVTDTDAVNGSAFKFESIESGKFTWRTGDFDPAPTDVTSVMRVKFVSGTVADRVTELEFRSNGLREKLVIYGSGRLKLEKASVDITPETLDVEMWNTYRMTMDASGVVNLYLNEDETPILSGTTTSTTTDNYIKFGDGGGSAYSCLVDYFLHETSGAYSPSELEIPTDFAPPPTEVATLSDLKVDDVSLEGFNSVILTYNVELPEGTTLVPIVTATTTDAAATMVITNATELPGTATVAVTSAQEIVTQTYTINFSVAAPPLPDPVWIVYDASVYPTEATPAMDTSSYEEGFEYTMEILDDAEVDGNSILNFGSPADGKFYWSTGTLDPIPTAVTAALRFKASENTDDRITELDMHVNGIREKLVIYADGRLKLEKAGVDTTNADILDVNQWNIVRITLNTIIHDNAQKGIVSLYLNEDPDPILSDTTTSTTSSSYIRFGDGGSSAYACHIDYFVYDVNGPYDPEASPIPADLVQPQWRLYDGSVDILEATNPSWVTSSDSGEFSWIVKDDEEVEGNKVLEMISLGGAGKTLRKTSDFAPVPEGMTTVVRVKSLSDTVDQAIYIEMRLDGFRDDLNVYTDDSLRLNRSGGEKFFVEGLDVSKWNVIRTTLDVSSGEYGVVRVYINENDTPVMTDTTTATTSDKYMKFGDGSSSSDYASLIDFVAYDMTGAYSPSEWALPDGLVPTPSDNAALSDLLIDDVTVEGFSSETLTYDVILPEETFVVPTVTAAPVHSDARAVIASPEELPGSTSIVVTAQDGITTQTYTINFTVVADVDDLIQSVFSIYPNPASDRIVFASDFNLVKVNVYGSNGQLILERTNSNSEQVSINISNLNKGLYLVRAIQKDGTVLQGKFIK